MNSTNSRRGFIASFVTWLTALPFVRAITGKPKSFDFHVRIEEIGEERYRAILNCGNKQAILESPIFDEGHPIKLWGHCARFGLLCEVNRSMKLLAFPQDKEMWMSPVWHWFEEVNHGRHTISLMEFKKPIESSKWAEIQSHEELLNRSRSYGLLDQSGEVKYTTVTCTNYPKS